MKAQIIVPRLLNQKQAAAYCGISVPIFVKHCPVVPIAIGAGKRLERYDLNALDNWIDSLSQEGASLPKDWLAKLDGDHDHRSHLKGSSAIVGVANGTATIGQPAAAS
jgi:hypothetical protein